MKRRNEAGKQGTNFEEWMLSYILSLFAASVDGLLYLSSYRFVLDSFFPFDGLGLVC